ncbi:hypothetical protein G6F56_002503 [Rhizopus delemar]|nr:hypothetical protein G6F56_002503 [Rhizopus delemar]
MTSIFRNSLFRKTGEILTRSISTANRPNYAFAFDIDGVLIKGKSLIPEATRALKLLNGDNAANRNKQIDPKAVVLSHSPMQNLADKYRDKRVLIVGGSGRKCFDVAKKYGFSDAVTPNDVMHWNTSAWPHSEPISDLSLLTSHQPLEFSKLPIHAVMVFYDSLDWGRDIQIMLDALCSNKGVLGTRKEVYSVQDVPLYWSNNDLIWSTDFPAPRLGQGAFKNAVEGLYLTLTGSELQSTSFGKPHAATYQFAEQIISSIAGGNQQGRNVYAVGDNPVADIKGANAYGWTSVLVKTGVFTGEDNSKEYPAHIVCENVEEAVEKVIAKEEGKL